MRSTDIGTNPAALPWLRGRRRAMVGLGGALAIALAIGACSAPSGADRAWEPAASGTAPSGASLPVPALAPGDSMSSPAAAAMPETPTTVVATGAISADDASGLLWMREEEKLARDIYLALAEQWGLQVFANIARSEQAHMDAVASLLDRYDLPDPAADQPLGVFSDPAIQALYDELRLRGGLSLVDALMVGATIEDLDIVDLRERATDTPDIARVYANLEQGSRNHLRAFVTNLARRGATYAPAALTLDEFDAIVSASRERGGQGGSGTRAPAATRKAGRP